MYISLSLAVQHMFTTHLLGTVDQWGDFAIARWARWVASVEVSRGALAIGASIVAVQAIYLALTAPYAIVKSEGWATTEMDEPVYKNETLRPL